MYSHANIQSRLRSVYTVTDDFHPVTCQVINFPVYFHLETVASQLPIRLPILTRSILACGLSPHVISQIPSGGVLHKSDENLVL